MTIGFWSLILTSMNIQTQYRRPILIAVLLHVVLFCMLIFNFAPTLFRMPPSSAPMNTIHATAISQATVQQEINAIQQKTSTAERAEANEKIKEQKAARAAVNEKIKEQIEARAAANAKQKAIAVAEKKHLQALAQKAKAVKAAKAAKAAAALTAKQKKLQQALMQQQLASEQKNISTIQAQAKAEAQAQAQEKAEAQALAVAQQGAIDKYKAAILSAIQSNWRIDQVNSKLKCVYSVQLAPDGTVLSVKLIQSSGDTALDQSAQQAITVSSPLPVPSNPGLFNHFRELVLTLSPQGFLQSVSSQ